MRHSLHRCTIATDVNPNEFEEIARCAATNVLQSVLAPEHESNVERALKVAHRASSDVATGR